jgi:CHRD domain
MRKIGFATLVGALLLALGAGSYAIAGDGDRARVNLTGYEETPLTLSTPGRGTFSAEIDEREREIEWELSYRSLESAAMQAHIHLGERAITGGISVFLCTNLGNGPPGTQPCPPQPATIRGTIRPADVLGPAAQGIAAGEFAELVAAIRAGATYANVHTVDRPGGEIRAQLKKGRKNDDRGNGDDDD